MRSISAKASSRKSGTFARKDWTGIGRTLTAWPRSAVHLPVLLEQRFLGLAEVGMLDDAGRRAHELALRLVLGADALGAAQRVDHVGRSLRDRLVRAHRD